MNELVDLSEGDFSELSTDGLYELATYTQKFYKRCGMGDSKSAVYCPEDIQFGISRIYQTWSDDSSEQVTLFKDLEEAKSWLKKLEG